MNTATLVVPQWQGSGSQESWRLPDGSRSAADLVDSELRIEAPVSQETGPTRDRVARLDVLAGNLAAIRGALASLDADTVVTTVGGDCGVEVAPIEAAMERYGTALTVLWLDAHPDLNTPDSSPSGAFHGMVLRTLLGEGPRELVPHLPLWPEQVVLCGVRALDPPERAYVEATGIRWFGVHEVSRIAELPGPIYVHLDADVLDPARFSATTCPEPEGVEPEALADALSRLNGVIGVGLMEHAPHEETAERDLAVLRSLVDALETAVSGS